MLLKAAGINNPFSLRNFIRDRYNNKAGISTAVKVGKENCAGGDYWVLITRTTRSPRDAFQYIDYHMGN